MRRYKAGWWLVYGGRRASQEYCYAHDPARSEERRRNASRAARSRPNRELTDVKALCEDLTERVLAGELETGRAAVANQLINIRLRAIEQERKNRETEEIAARVEELERRLQTNQRQKGRRAW